MKKTAFLLFLIIVLAVILRIWHLGNVPPSPDWDEASLGYNAYSIMQTGRDEYGKLLPFVLRSFDDYKPGLYAYFIIPLIKLFGLSVFSVRLPSALFGTLTVLGTFLLVKEFFKKNNVPAFLSSFLLAISPWHIQFSRVAFESNVGVAFNLFSILFFFKSFKKPWLLIISFALMAINLYVYQSEKVFTPLLFLSLVLIFKTQFFSIPRRYLLLSAVVGFIVILPMIGYTLTNKNALARAQGVSVFADTTPFLKSTVQKIDRDKQKNDTVGFLLDNRRFSYAKTVISGYLSHFNSNWLFVGGDLARHHAPDMGIMYLVELPFLLIGIYSIPFGFLDLDKRIRLFLIIWMLIVPIPASITSGVPHAVRTLNFLPVLQIITTVGLLRSFMAIRNRRFFLAYSAIFLLLFFLNFFYYLDQYFVQQNYYNSSDWQFGYQETVSTVKEIAPKYTKIVVQNKPYLDQSYIFFLFYLQYPPLTYQKESLNSSGGFREDHVFGKYEFRQVTWDKEKKDPKTLYVGKADDFPPGVKELKTIYFLNGTPAIKIVEG